MEYDTAYETQILDTGNTVSILICQHFSKAYLGFLLQQNRIVG